MDDPVKRGHVPDWFSRVLNRAGVPFLGLGWVDHHGSLESDGRTLFVSEPYSVCGPASEELAAFIALTRCTLTVTAPGAWHSGTVRLSVGPPPHEDDARYELQEPCRPRWPLTHAVYALADPRDGLYRYVGITDDLKRRAAQHRNGEGLNRAKRAWIAGLRESGLEFGVTTLERVSWVNAKERERYWMVKLRRDGHPLLTAEYGRPVNAAPDEWQDLAFALRAVRSGMFDAQGKVLKVAGASNPAYGLLQRALQNIDRARCRLDSTLWNLIRDDSVSLVFFGGED